MLTICACLWDPNEHSQAFSRCYDERWVEKLYRGFRRNLTPQFRFVLFTDRVRKFNEPIEQELLSTNKPTYAALLEPFRLNVPMIVCGLDTIVTSSVDEYWNFCYTSRQLGLLRDPYKPERSINGITLVPEGFRKVWDDWDGVSSDMETLRKYDSESVFIDDIWPGSCKSVKFHKLREVGVSPETKIAYFHGRPKPQHIQHLDWVKTNWI